MAALDLAPGRHKARDLRAAFTHAERASDEVLILSPPRGLVAPACEIDAYNLDLDGSRKDERQQWTPTRSPIFNGTPYVGQTGSCNVVVNPGAQPYDTMDSSDLMD